jgi:probable phosphoglycerate mutase
MRDSANRQSFVLLRHGETTWNEMKLVQGQNDEAHLNAKGVEQAREVAAALLEDKFDAIISSDLCRALETAEIVGQALGLSIEVAAALRERSFGAFEGRSLAELTTSLSGIEDHVVLDDEAHPEGGESLRQLLQRAGHFMHELHSVRENQRLLLVTHGGTIRAIRAYCAGATMSMLPWDRVANCSIWTVALPLGSELTWRAGRP